MRTRLIVAAIGIVAVASWGVVILRDMSREEVRTARGTITGINLAERTVSIEFIHPKTAQALRIDSHVLPDGDIRIDGRPAALADLRIDDRAEVEVAFQRFTGASANSIHVTRAGRASVDMPMATRCAGDP